MTDSDRLASIETLLVERDLRYNERFEAQALAVNAALTAAKEAVNKAEVAAEKRFDAANEFRGQLSDQAATFMPRLESEQRMGELERRLIEVGSRLDTMTGRSSGFTDGYGYVVGIVGTLIAVAAIAVGAFT